MTATFKDRTVRTPPTGCPVCMNKLDAAMTVDGERTQPQPGDVSICLHCLAFLEFEAHGQVRQLSTSAAAKLEPAVQRKLVESYLVIRDLNLARAAERGDRT